jgi:tryptophan halogenase
MDVPDSLRERLELFHNAGALREGVDELFRDASWISVLEGMGRRPRGHHLVADLPSGQELSAALFAAVRSLAMKVESLPTHSDFIQSICASPA